MDVRRGDRREQRVEVLVVAEHLRLEAQVDEVTDSAQELAQPRDDKLLVAELDVSARLDLTGALAAGLDELPPTQRRGADIGGPPAWNVDQRERDVPPIAD